MHLKIWKKTGGEDCRVALEVSVAEPGCREPWYRSEPVLQVDEATIDVDGDGRDVSLQFATESLTDDDWAAIYAEAREYVRKDF
jgi:hypothetical protein